MRFAQLQLLLAVHHDVAEGASVVGRFQLSTHPTTCLSLMKLYFIEDWFMSDFKQQNLWSRLSQNRVLQILLQEKEFVFLASIAVLGALLPHPANVSPIAALGLFAGIYLRSRIFLLVPLVAVFIADITSTGLYNLLVLVFVYAGFMLSSVIGRYFVRGRSVAVRAPVAVLLMSLGFFLVSNLGNWLAFFPATFAGLIDCYVQGLPYFFRTLAGNTMYSLLFIGGYELLNVAVTPATNKLAVQD